MKANRKKRQRDPGEEDTASATPKVAPALASKDLRDDERYKKSMYLAYVRDTLRKKAQGDITAYDELVGRFNASNALMDATSAQELRLLMSALSHVVSQLDRHHPALVDAVLSLSWITADVAFVKSYIAFIGMLVSARPEYNYSVLEKAVEGLTHQSGLRALHSGHAEGSTHPLTRREVYDRQHELLQHVLSLVPTLANTLQPILVRKFPHKRQDKIAQVTYIRNVLRVTEYCSELSDRILATVIDRAIQIDVEIQVELEELEAEGDTSEGPVFEIDPFESIVGQDIDEEEEEEDNGEDALSDLSSEGGEFDDDEPNAVQQRDTAHIQDMAIKLDAILKLVFDHFHNTHASSAPMVVYGSASQLSDGGPEWTVPLTTEQGRALRRSQFRTLLFIFERTILRTFKSRYTQFLLFWYSSLDPEFTDNFLGLLLNKALVEFDQPSVTRAAAASYVASFVSRAQFVDGESARRVVGLLCAYLSRQLEVYAEADGPTHTLQYTVFYAVAQAVFLIFCFRWRELQLESGQEEPSNDLWVANGGPTMKKWIPELDVIQRVIISALNPLKVCSVNVVQQFARVAQTTGFAYCYSILESNRRSEYNSAADSTSTFPQNGQPSKAHSDGRLLLQAHAAQVQAHPLVIRDSAVEADLNTFFPFDPYKLPLSHSYIDGVYREWSSVALDDGEESGESDEDGEAPEDNEVSSEGEAEHAEDVSERGKGKLAFETPMVVNSLSASSSAEDLGKSFGGMSISPLRRMELGSYVALQA